MLRLFLYLVYVFLLQCLLGASISGFSCSGLCAFPVEGYCYNLSAFSGLKLSGPQAMGHSGHYEVSLCGNLTNPCIDSLTGVRIFGYLYTFFGNSTNQDKNSQESHCWDVLSKLVNLFFLVSAYIGIPRPPLHKRLWCGGRYWPYDLLWF